MIFHLLKEEKICFSNTKMKEDIFKSIKKEKQFDKSLSKSKDKSMKLVKDALLLTGGVVLLGAGVKVIGELFD